MAKAWAKAFYNSGQWRAVRELALRRDGFSCQECGARAEEVHHEIELTPQNINDPRISLNLNLLHSLCGDCHKAITKKQKGFVNEDCDDEFYFDERGQLVPRGVGDF